MTVRRVRFEYAEVVGATTESQGPAAQPADQTHALLFVLDGNRTTLITRAATAEALGARKAALEAFLTEHGLPER